MAGTSKPRRTYPEQPCGELLVLQQVVKTTTETLTELKHEILGNSKKGMKHQLNSISDTVEKILPEVEAMSKERQIRKLQDEQEKLRKKSWSAIGMVVLEKIAAPIVLAVALYLLLGIK